MAEHTSTTTASSVRLELGRVLDPQGQASEPFVVPTSWITSTAAFLGGKESGKTSSMVVSAEATADAGEAFAGLHPRPLSRREVAILAVMSAQGGAFGQRLTDLHDRGLLRQADDRKWALSEAGLRLVDPAPAAGSEQLTDRWRRHLRGKAGAKTVQAFTIVAGHRDGLTTEQLAQRIDMKASGGGYGRLLATLRRYGLIHRDGRHLRPTPALFLGDDPAPSATIDDPTPVADARPAPPVEDGAQLLRRGERQLLEAILARREGLTVPQAGTLAGIKRPSTLSTYVSTLRRLGLVVDAPEGRLEGTERGRDVAGDIDSVPRSTHQLVEQWRAHLRRGEGRLLDELVTVYPNPVPLSDLTRRTRDLRLSETTLRTYLSTLRRMGLVQDLAGEKVRASPTLFPDVVEPASAIAARPPTRRRSTTGRRMDAQAR